MSSTPTTTGSRSWCSAPSSIDVLDAALRQTVARIDGADLESIRPDGAEAVTVEVFARWAHGALAEPVRMAGAESLTVRVWESPVAFGGYAGPLGTSSS